MKGLQNLEIWQEALQLSIDVYRLSSSFPEVERHGLAAQARWSSVSVASNIAEGYGRFSRRDCARFLTKAIGTLHGLQTQCCIAKQLDYIRDSDFDALTERMRILLARTLSYRKTVLY